MIFPKKMTRVRITGPKHLMKKTIGLLYDAHALHLEDYQKDSGDGFLKGGIPFETAAIYSEQLVKCGSLLSALGITGAGKELTDLKVASAKLFGIESRYVSISQEISAGREHCKQLEQQIQCLEPIHDLGLKPEHLGDYGTLAVFKGTVKKPPGPALKKIAKDHELFTAPYGQGANRTAIALFVPLPAKDAAQELLAKHGFEPFASLPSAPLATLRAEHRQARSALSKSESELGNLKSSSAQFLLDCEHTLTKENQKSEAPIRFATSATAFVLYGWVPSSSLSTLGPSLEEKLNGAVCVEEFEDRSGAPVALDNPGPVTPFEFFMNLYSLPRYTELDPTFLMFLTFPLFFGFILGDIGYGITTLIVFAAMRRMLKGSGIRRLLSVLMLSSLATIAFGCVFGEFFGVEIVEHPILNRVHDITTVLLVAVAIGAVHINIGILAGFYNVMKQHSLRHAILEKGAWFVLELGAALLAADALGFAAIGPIPGAALLILSIAMLYKGEGVKGLIEIPALLSNILSYARLFAVGLASVELALIINEFAGSFIAQGGVYIAVAVALLLGGHGLNILLGILGGFLHSLRLHYVEFFTKFFEGGGKRYAPFGSQ